MEGEGCNSLCGLARLVRFSFLASDQNPHLPSKLADRLQVYRDSFTTDLLPYLDCVILGPGPGTPHNENDFSWPHRLIEELGDRLPVFGLCLGCQGLATVFGGKVRRLLRGWADR